MDVEKRYFELRQEGEDSRRLTGVAVRYGDIAQLPWGKERIDAGAFAPIDDVILNAQHDRSTPLARTDGGGLELQDGTEALTIVAKLPDTRPADDVLELIRKKILRGLSIEFLPKAERMAGGVRVITRAKLSGVAVVDRPAYAQSEIEARRGRYLPLKRARDKRRIWV